MRSIAVGLQSQCPGGLGPTVFESNYPLHGHKLAATLSPNSRRSPKAFLLLDWHYPSLQAVKATGRWSVAKEPKRMSVFKEREEGLCTLLL